MPPSQHPSSSRGHTRQFSSGSRLREASFRRSFSIDLDSARIRTPTRPNMKKEMDGLSEYPAEVEPLIHEPEQGQDHYLDKSENAALALEIDDFEAIEPAKKTANVAGVICVLLLGVFIANADSSLVLATYGKISSEFGQLENSSWLLTTYNLAMCAFQPISGKMSDIYGRKSVLLVSYLLFGLGAVLCGAGQSMQTVLIGRVISGIGGSGMSSLVSILITDLVPLIEVAAWRSYVNVVATAGRSLGGPLGGILADTLSWRWSFIGQGPIIGIAIALVAAKLYVPAPTYEPGALRKSSRLARIDFVGAFLVASTIVAFLLALDLGGQKLPWTHPLIIFMIVAAIVLGALFVIYEDRVARDPIFPPRLLMMRDVITAYLVMALQTAAQLGVMYAIPLYFQITQGANSTEAGAHLLPAVVGNTVGGLLAGMLIKKSGKYKDITVGATVIGAIGYILLLTRWHGDTSVLESMYVIPGGFSVGVVAASSFMALTSSVAHEDMAVATSGMYLSANIGVVSGISLASAVCQTALGILLRNRLTMDGADEIIFKSISDANYIATLPEDVKLIVQRCYVIALEYTYAVPLTLSVIATALSLTIRENPLR
ncbi:MFS general substrate transporter [Fistulina hepatica ATCC 64428]|uniref:MFS general substrate transporter n=1 Tax=Fistulina hepatica ATCC 64428 TaxID=1128425 RepID=A0A0D7ADE0_9AGAR|nr:MFS general substrate transporter [Fistulina hepatica ATCC 64428]